MKTVNFMKRSYIYEGVEKKTEKSIEKRIMLEFIEDLCKHGYLEYSKKMSSDGILTIEMELAIAKLKDFRLEMEEKKKLREQENETNKD